MGNSFRKMFDKLFGNREMRVVMLGLDAAGKTTILYKLHIGEVLSTVPTIGFNVEKVQYKNVLFTVWDVGGQEKLRPLWRHYFNNTDGLIYVVDSQDRERVQRAATEFKAIVDDPLMRHSAVLVFANKQDLVGLLVSAKRSSANVLCMQCDYKEQWLDQQSHSPYHKAIVARNGSERTQHVQKGALTTAEVCEALGLGQLKNRSWHVQGAISIRGEGLYEGLDWLANTLKNMQRSGQVTNVTAAGR